ncbi:hypothetical protein QTP88_017417 [Uroleucon formosanum]
MVEKTSKHISTINFEDIFKEAEHFSEQMNNSLEDLKLSENEIFECELPQPCIRSKKGMADELCRDETPLDVKDKYCVEDVKEGLQGTALQKLSELASIDHLKLVTELRCKQSSKSNHHCSKYLICVQKLLYSLNMHSTAYKNVYAAYEFVLSLSVSQVNCERAFSILKIIKNWLRSSLNQERLEAFMMMSVEKQILEEVDFQDVLEIIKNSSSVLLKLLS